MAWSLSNSPDAITFSSPPNQHFGYDMTEPENNSVNNQYRVFPATTPFKHNDFILSGYDQRRLFNPNTTQSSSQFVSPGNFTSLDNLLGKQSGFEYHEKPFTTGLESFCLNNHTSTFPAIIPFTPRTNQDRVPKKESTSHRVTKKSPSNSPLECGWKGCERPRPFTDKGTLLRHIKNQHVDPHSFKCPSKECVKTFSGKDNMEEHLFRVHQKKALL